MSFGDKLSKILGGRVRRYMILMAFDIICFAVVAGLFLILQVYGVKNLEDNYVNAFILGAGIQLCLVVVLRILFSVYTNVWRYTNTKAYLYLIIADVLASLLTIGAMLIVRKISYGFYAGVTPILIVGATTSILTLISRFLYAIIYKKYGHKLEDKIKLPVAIVGAGRLGTYLVGDLQNNGKSDYLPMFYIDKDPSKIGKVVGGLKVYDYKTARGMIKTYNIHTVIIAITRSTSENLNSLYQEYTRLGCKVRVYESLFAPDNADRKNKLRDFTIEDLLFRKPIEINDTKSLTFYRGKVVLVTGGGGSIGSEICRQISACSPSKLIIFDIYENNAYDIQQELIRKYGDSLDLYVEIGSVRDRDRLEQVFVTYKPDIVFHAAAHKHVPLMERSACESIKNNCFGTYNTADMAEKYGVKKFILISTDKAVNPTNVMGASKRICEMIIQSRTDSKTSFSAVRFGNVLGSNGSVIPLFRKQIEEGGPVTITDKRIIRYFMTIPEAAQLVIESGSMAKSGDLFVLDMGNPVKIYDLASNMIQLMGLIPNVDIDIKEIGLRPGEKLYEELLMKTENLDKTDNNLIFIEHDTPYTRKEIDKKLNALKKAISTLTTADCSVVKEAIKEVVPTFHMPEELNRTASESTEMKLAKVVDDVTNKKEKDGNVVA